MKRLFACLLVLGVAAAVLAPAVGQGPEKKDQPPGKDGPKDRPPPKDGFKDGPKDGPKDRPPMKDRGPGDKGPPRFELGHVLPPFAVDHLDLSADQKKQIADLEKDVKARLEKILTADQRKKLETLGPPRGPGDRPPADRPPPDRPPQTDRPLLPPDRPR